MLSAGSLMQRLLSVGGSRLLLCGTIPAFSAVQTPISHRYVSVRSAGSHTSSGSKRWSIEDVEQLCQLRSAGHSFEAITAKLKGRTYAAVKKKLSNIRRLKPEFSRRLHALGWHYTKREDDLMFEMKAAGHSWKKIAEHMPGRNPMALKSHYAGIREERQGRSERPYSPEHFFARKRSWSAEEDHELYQLRKTLKLSWAQISAKLHRTSHAVSIRYRALGHIDAPAKRTWTVEEDAKVLTKSGKNTWKDVATELPGRSAAGVCYRYNCLMKVLPDSTRQSARRWKVEEDVVLRDMAVAGASIERMLEALPGRTISAVRTRVQHLRGWGKPKT